MLVKYEQELTGEIKNYKYLDNYFSKEDHFPFFISTDGTISGFVLVNSYCIATNGSKSISEFFIHEEYRRKGIGKAAAMKTFDMFPGKWEIRQLSTNLNGHMFWKKVISEYTKNNFKEVFLDEDRWHGPVQIFEN